MHQAQTHDLVFGPSRARIGLRIVAISVPIIAAALFVALAIATSSTPGNLALRLIAVVVILGLAFVIAAGAITDMPPSVDATGVSLQRSLRRANGTHTRRLDFSDVVGVQPAVANGYNGLEITLRDGIRTFLPQATFGNDGFRVMSAISAKFGRSYQGDITKFLLEGRDGERFRVVRIRGTANGLWHLSQAVPTFSGKTIRQIRRGAIKHVERVSTPYTGVAFMVTLVDETRFLVPERDASKSGLSLLLNGA